MNVRALRIGLARMAEGKSSYTGVTVVTTDWWAPGHCVVGVVTRPDLQQVILFVEQHSNAYVGMLPNEILHSLPSNQDMLEYSAWVQPADLSTGPREVVGVARMDGLGSKAETTGTSFRQQNNHEGRATRSIKDGVYTYSLSVGVDLLYSDVAELSSWAALKDVPEDIYDIIARIYVATRSGLGLEVREGTNDEVIKEG